MDVKFVREKAELSQQELADKLGVSRSLVGMWESGDREPSKDQRIALAAALPMVETGALWPNRGRSDPYPSAPAGGRPGSQDAEDRRVHFARRNARIQGNDPDVAEARVLQDIQETQARQAGAKS